MSSYRVNGFSRIWKSRVFPGIREIRDPGMPTLSSIFPTPTRLALHHSLLLPLQAVKLPTIFTLTPLLALFTIFNQPSRYQVFKPSLQHEIQ
uniref:Uncharacterized protein n=1 Tax=Heterorhabditis bacteriophora TaxID=37862 RepID=A0A1I7XCP9_HETBA